MNYLTRITINPDICFGKPCIRGMRWPVAVVLDLLSSGMSFAEVLEDHPELEREDILAALQYAKLTTSGKSIYDMAS
ncbi:MAG: DUF433 domain-containing protein [Flammeovirgaceae bacterium]|jgi:uncharacterized protein (DUF433 family)|nr:DUF433 domain-containing protein [Flammeovirgaceae bacterium]